MFEELKPPTTSIRSTASSGMICLATSSVTASCLSCIASQQTHDYPFLSTNINELMGDILRSPSTGAQQIKALKVISMYQWWPVPGTTAYAWTGQGCTWVASQMVSMTM